MSTKAYHSVCQDSSLFNVNWGFSQELCGSFREVVFEMTYENYQDGCSEGLN